MTAGVEHPSWCQLSECRVRLDAGVPAGAHRSRIVVIGAQSPDEVEVRLCVWQVHGRQAHVSVDWNRPHGVPVDGILFDPDDARVLGRLLRALADEATR